MIFSEQIFKVDSSSKAREQIEHLNRRRAELVSARTFITKRMAQGTLDYRGVTRDAWVWRFETVYNDVQEETQDDGTGELKTVLTTSCSFKTAEQFYDMPYFTYKICQDVDRLGVEAQQCVKLTSTNCSCGIS